MIAKKLDNVLNDLQRIGGVENSAIVTRDGILIKTTIPEEQHAETFAAMSATMLGAAEAASVEMGKGFPESVTVESRRGEIIITGAGPKAVLVVTTGPDANLDLILNEIEKMVAVIKEIL